MWGEGKLLKVFLPGQSFGFRFASHTNETLTVLHASFMNEVAKGIYVHRYLRAKSVSTLSPYSLSCQLRNYMDILTASSFLKNIGWEILFYRKYRLQRLNYLHLQCSCASSGTNPIQLGHLSVWGSNRPRCLHPINPILSVSLILKPLPICVFTKFVYNIGEWTSWENSSRPHAVKLWYLDSHFLATRRLEVSGYVPITNSSEILKTFQQ